MPETISIITICFNNPEELKATCASVDAQTRAPYEHWIIDGSSNTAIKEWLENNPQPAYRKWLCERDKGIGDAFNKGIALANGTVLNMLNSADTYIDPTTLQQVIDLFAQQPALSWLHSKYRLQRGGQWVIIGKRFEAGKLYRGMRSLCHQSMFVKKELHTRYGNYNNNLRNAMDYDFVCRIAKEPVAFIEKPLVEFAPGGTTYANHLKALGEGRKVYETHFGYSIKLVLWQLRLRFLHFLLNSPFGSFMYKIKVWLRLENL